MRQAVNAVSVEVAAERQFARKSGALDPGRAPHGVKGAREELIRVGVRGKTLAVGLHLHREQVRWLEAW